MSPSATRGSPMNRRSNVWSRSLIAGSAALVLLLPAAGSATAGPAAVTGSGSSGYSSPPKTLLFASDGMRPDLVDKYAGQGAMPTMKDLMKRGVKGQNGLVQAFPPNTGVGWA